MKLIKSCLSACYADHAFDDEQADPECGKSSSEKGEALFPRCSANAGLCGKTRLMRTLLGSSRGDRRLHGVLN